MVIREASETYEYTAMQAFFELERSIAGNAASSSPGPRVPASYAPAGHGRRDKNDDELADEDDLPSKTSSP